MTSPDDERNGLVARLRKPVPTVYDCKDAADMLERHADRQASADAIIHSLAEEREAAYDRATRGERRIAELKGARDRAEASAARMRAALEPFAKIEVPHSAEDGTWVATTLFCNDQVTAHSVRAARAALAIAGDPTPSLGVTKAAVKAGWDAYVDASINPANTNLECMEHAINAALSSAPAPAPDAGKAMQDRIVALEQIIYEYVDPYEVDDVTEMIVLDIGSRIAAEEHLRSATATGSV